MGLLTSRGPPDWHPANHKPHIIEACQKANAYCTAQGVDISRLAMFFSLANPDIPTTLGESCVLKGLLSEANYFQTLIT